MNRSTTRHVHFGASRTRHTEPPLRASDRNTDSARPRISAPLPRAPTRRKRSDRDWLRHVIDRGFATISAAGPTGWIALVAIAAMALAAYALYAMLTLSTLRQ